MSKFRPITRITSMVIHCSATPNGRWTTVEEIDSWHSKRDFSRDEKLVGHHMPHLKSIGYHHAIYTNGAVVNGRRYCETGAHALDLRYPKGDGRRYRWNNESIGVCMIGTDQFSFEQWESLRSLVQACKKDFPGLKIIAHHQINSHKTCPGFDVSAWLRGGMIAPALHLLEGQQ